MTIAITGASGFIGSRLTHDLLAEGNHVRILVHKSIPENRAEAVQGDIHDFASLQRLLKGVDTLYHLASALGGRRLPKAEYFLINSEGTEQVMRAAVDCGVNRVIHFSSAGVYGNNSGRVPLQEDDPLNPVDSYERSKREGEAIALAFAGRLNLSVIRPGWVYGEGDGRTFKLIRQIACGPFFIAGDGENRHSVIHVSDLIRLARIVAAGGSCGGVYNGGGENLPVKKIVAQIAASLGKRKRYARVPLALVNPAAFICEFFLGASAPLDRSKLAFFRRGKPLDMTKVRGEFGFEPEIGFDDGIARAVEWYRKHGWL